MSSQQEIRPEAYLPLDELPPEDVIFGTSARMRLLRQYFEKLADTTAPVLISGETGTGKEVLARHLHRKSPWGNSPLLKLHCPSQRCSLTEEDPLGLTISGIVQALPAQQAGVSRQSLLLANVALLDPILQVNLLERLGEDPLIHIRRLDGCDLELRLICTTNQPLGRQVAGGRFQGELEHAIGVFRVDVPSLAQRRGDIPQVVSYLLDHFRRKLGIQRPAPSQQIFDQMNEYNWPGNFRQLENLVLRYVVQGRDDVFLRDCGTNSFPRGSTDGVCR